MKHHLIPFPASVIASTGNFVVSNTTGFSIEPSVELEGLGNYLAEQIRGTTGMRDIINTAKGEQKDGSIRLALDGDTGLGEEGYELSISENATQLGANHLARFFMAFRLFVSPCPPFRCAIRLASGAAAQCSMWRGTSSVWRI